MNNSFVDNPLNASGEFHPVDEIVVDPPAEEEGWDLVGMVVDSTTPPERRGRASTEIDVNNLFEVNLMFNFSFTQKEIKGVTPLISFCVKEKLNIK